ncbi:MAG TPA: hypothetical protein VK548_09330 [Candidatus Acidoferrum sp.]|nr:hypothetical protein [Candidatus Acidoferrum sp.]
MVGDASRLAVWLGIWGIALAVIAIVRWRRSIGGVGLTLTYLVQLTAFHGVGAAIYLFPWDWTGSDPGMVELGLEQTVYGLLGFGVGAVVIAPFVARLFGVTKNIAVTTAPEPTLAKVYFAVGILFYLLSATFLGRIPTVSAVIGTGRAFLLVGLGLSAWVALRSAKKFAFLAWVAAAMWLPLFTLISAGFLGFGAIALVMVVTLLVSLRGIGPRGALLAMLCVYLGLSIYVTYMRDRRDIRDVVWTGGDLTARFQKVEDMVRAFEWFDPYDTDHLERIDSRLNQNTLVGAAVDYIASNPDAFARGETVLEAFWALVPRIIWPDKPMAAGSGTWVSRYTGITFEENTSVGMGQVLEFYINFGTAGVVIGFLLLGTVIASVDSIARSRVVVGDWPGFVLWYVPGTALLQAGGSLMEITSSAAAAAVAAMLINRYVFLRLRPQAPAAATQDSLAMSSGGAASWC